MHIVAVIIFCTVFFFFFFWGGGFIQLAKCWSGHSNIERFTVFAMMALGIKVGPLNNTKLRIME